MKAALSGHLRGRPAARAEAPAAVLVGLAARRGSNSKPGSATRPHLSMSQSSTCTRGNVSPGESCSRAPLGEWCVSPLAGKEGGRFPCLGRT